MEIRFLGAARTVTGSMHAVSANGRTILLDCGLFQGKRQESFERNKTFPFEPASIHAVVLSHAHTDHAGNLPNLVRSGFRGPIYSTPATRDLCNVMLYDSAYIQERDVDYVNRKRQKSHLPPVEPLYSPADVGLAMSRFVSVGYGREFDVADGMRGTFSDAGHILGSAVLSLTIDEKGIRKKIGFTGDLGRKNTPILRDPVSMGDVDILISESTYGGRVHGPMSGTKAALLSVIRRTVDRGGKVVVPSFSLGRTQELVYMLFQLIDEKALPEVPVYVDSPLAVDATHVFRMHPECFDAEMLSYLHHNEDPFGFGKITYVRSVDESKRLNSKPDPCVIISASGMCEAGRVLHHLANTVGNEKNAVLIVGFQAEHTLGRRIVERDKEVRIFGEMYPLKAEVAVINALSAHAGQDELLDYIGALDADRLKNIFLVHGELAQAEALAAKLKDLRIRSVTIPSRGDRVGF